MFDATSFSLTGKRALVTGGRGGLGRSIAVALARMGAEVCVTGRDLASLDTTLAELSATGRPCLARQLDITDLTAIDQLVGSLVADLGPIDILVNNAGYEQVTPSLDLSEAIWDTIIDTNLKGSFFASRAVARHMAASGQGGTIINLCSLTSYVGIPTAVPYGASKSGLLGMTRALAAEWAEYGIRVNALAPGYFRTEMTEPFYQDNTWATAMLAKIPQRRFGALDDIAGAAVFLASPASGYITGQCLPVDGGYLASI